LLKSQQPEGKRQNAKGKSANHGTFRDNCAFGLLHFAFRLSSQANPDVMRCVANAHESKVGVYTAVLVEGAIGAGDRVTLLD